VSTVYYLLIIAGVFVLNSASRSRTWGETIQSLGDAVSAIVTADPSKLKEALTGTGTLDGGADPAKVAAKAMKDPGGAANGELPDSALMAIPFASGKRLTPDAVKDLVALNKAYAAEFGHNMVITDAYRTLAQQKSVKASKGNLAAEPGTSVHGWGKAIDVGDGVNHFGSAQYVWMKNNAPNYGWNHPSWAEPSGSKPEPWHWEHA